MAEAIIAGLLNKRVVNAEQIYVTNKENEARLNELKQAFNVVSLTDKEAVIKGADAVIIATKPYEVVDSLHHIKDYLEEDQLVISVVAGISTNLIEQTLNKNVPVIRTMPNTSATIGYSATAMTKGTYATDDHVQIAKRLFEAIGTVSIIEEEK